MPARRVRKSDGKSALSESVEQISELRIVARLIGLAVVKGGSMGEQASTLSAAGFPASEIAKMLGTTPASVRQQIYMWRKPKSNQKRVGVSR